eukprot:CAMPEP_0176288892 /NCGR_PEP_ID=MMETSP0121_2-20121125/54211_1 /TAXON_ID=160619 /ORGANISM="Kryptoperidinium foliaceum, Strain CCMP 1326" /LENGTH=216 /DNA_ID=CAMNT_0017629605 /DNA_START=72 /DNA_END=721 /DNA_ORIENTATION=-
MALRILPLVLALFAQPWLACAAGPTEAAPARQASEEAPQGASEEATKEEAEHAAQSGEAQDGASVSVDEEAAHEAAAQEVAKLPLLAQGGRVAARAASLAAPSRTRPGATASASGTRAAAKATASGRGAPTSAAAATRPPSRRRSGAIEGRAFFWRRAFLAARARGRAQTSRARGLERTHARSEVTETPRRGSAPDEGPLLNDESTSDAEQPHAAE